MARSTNNNENNVELNFLSAERRAKLAKIAEETSKFILLSTYQSAQTEWFSSDRRAKEISKYFFEMNGHRISSMVTGFFKNGLSLTPVQQQSVLDYLFVQTQQNCAAMQIQKCSRHFFKGLFDKFSGPQQPKKDGKRPRGDGAGTERPPLKKLRPNFSISITPIVMVPASPFMPYRSDKTCRSQFGNLFQRNFPSSTVVSAPSNTSAIRAAPGKSNSTGPIALMVFKKGEKEGSKNVLPSTSTQAVADSKKVAIKNEVNEEQGKMMDDMAVKAELVKSEKIKKEKMKEENKETDQHDKNNNCDEKKSKKEKNRRTEIFGDNSDDPYSDVEFICSYTVALAKDDKFVSLFSD